MLPAIEASHNGRVVALASRDPERAARILRPYPQARALASYDEVIADPEVDCVYVPLTNDLHKEWTLRALQAGKHVLCEKPLAMNAQEAEAMAAAAEAAGRKLMEAFMYRFDPEIREFVELERGAVHVQATFGFTLPAGENYRRHAELGGGALLDVGCYTVNVARWLLGEPVDVLARARLEGGVDMSVAALLQFEGGRTAAVWASFESAEAQEVTAITRQAVSRYERPFNSLEAPLEPYRLMVESFADSVLHDRPVAIAPADSIANMRVLDRIRAAALASSSSSPLSDLPEGGRAPRSARRLEAGSGPGRRRPPV